MESIDHEDIDVYLIRSGAETFERPMNGNSDDWVIGEPIRKAHYVTLSQVVSFPETAHQGNLVFRDWERRVLIAVSMGYGVLELVSDEEIKLFKDNMKKQKRSSK